MVFDGVLDTLSTVKVPTFNFTLTVITVSTLATAMIGFLETWYWQPIWTMPILIGAFIVDLYTAIRLTGEMAGHTFVFETRKFKKDDIVVINLSGRGDKDLSTLIEKINFDK